MQITTPLIPSFACHSTGFDFRVIFLATELVVINKALNILSKKCSPSRKMFLVPINHRRTFLFSTKLRTHGCIFSNSTGGNFSHSVNFQHLHKQSKCTRRSCKFIMHINFFFRYLVSSQWFKASA
jgi:hypothetical protein